MGCREHEVFPGRLETWPAAEMLRDLEPSLIPPMDAKRVGWTAQIAEAQQGGERGRGTTTPSPLGDAAGAGQVPGGTVDSPERCTLSCWAGDLSPGHIPQPLLWRAPIWRNPNVTELAWRVPKLDIVNEIAEREGQVRALRSQQGHNHSHSKGIAGSSPLRTVTSSASKGEGD